VFCFFRPLHDGSQSSAHDQHILVLSYAELSSVIIAVLKTFLRSLHIRSFVCVQRPGCLHVLEKYQLVIASLLTLSKVIYHARI
jgi:hypothetical protein